VISVWVQRAGGSWFGIAEHEARLVATAIGVDREAAASAVRGCLPRGREFRMADAGSAYARGVLRLLGRLEAGAEEIPVFALCPDCVGEPLASVLRAASAIPRGYVATYGGLAAVAGTGARVVGRMMATNPLYPIVPCHRVVGSDLGLVGYGGRRDPAALRAKLARLRAEARGFPEERRIEAARGLRVYPVERVIRKAARQGLDTGPQLSLW